MRKNLAALIIVAVVLVAGGVYLATKNSDKNNTTNASSMDMSSGSTDQTAPNQDSTPQATNSVTIQNFAFSPADITVKAGTKVTWINQDSTAHTVTETDSQVGPNSGDLAQGESYSFTFAKAGTYHYHCSIHSEMTGTVTVTQ
ncbi:MAG TPA: cupredoxin family copper-binding protein [Candidatus Saccharimonadales bacterium]|nr:cupredoxin family copper-binding protein [Candidatus Saccharimonadales bacterium]